jgi:hypothetical protein
MKTNRTMKIGSVLVAVALAGSVTMAGDRGRDYRGGHGDGGRSYRGHYDGGRHYGCYRNARGDLFFGLLGIGMAAAIVAAVDRPVYVQQPVQVVYQEPRVIYVQQPQVVQQPVVVQVEQPRPAMVTINIQNSNGSFTPVTLHSVGSQWVGPKGEYYDAMPTVGQLRQVYGF